MCTKEGCEAGMPAAHRVSHVNAAKMADTEATREERKATTEGTLAHKAKADAEATRVV